LLHSWRRSSRRLLVLAGSGVLQVPCLAFGVALRALLDGWSRVRCCLSSLVACEKPQPQLSTVQPGVPCSFTFHCCQLGCCLTCPSAALHNYFVLACLSVSLLCGLRA
jgi:hypothetical protein